MNNNLGVFNLSSSNPAMLSPAQMTQMKSNMTNNMNINRGFNVGQQPGTQIPSINVGIPPANGIPPSMNNGMGNINLAMLQQPVQITGPTQGTSIASLKGVQPKQNNINNSRQVVLSQQNPHIRQHPRSNFNNNPDLSDDMSQGSYASNAQSYNNDEVNKIKHLVNGLNKSLEHYKSLEDYAPSKSNFSDDSDVDNDDNSENSDSETSEPDKKQKPNNDEKETYHQMILNSIKECTLIIIIYILLSQEFFKKGIHNFIPQTEISGETTFIGTIVYGSILATVYVFFRRILF